MTMLQDVFNAASELTVGNNTPSLKLALFAAAMSSCQSLSANGRQTRILAQYVNQPLPDKDSLVEILRPAKGFINKTHLKALYRIEELHNQGMLDQYTTIG